MSARASAYAKTLVVCPNGERLSRGEKLVLIVLADNHQDKAKHFTYPSVETLAEDALCDRRTCQRHLASLERKGVIRRMRPANQGSGMTVFYFFTALDAIPEGWQNAALSEPRLFALKGGKRAAEGRQKGGKSCSPSITNMNLEPELEAIPPNPPQAGGVSEEQADVHVSAEESGREVRDADAKATAAPGATGKEMAQTGAKDVATHSVPMAAAECPQTAGACDLQPHVAGSEPIREGVLSSSRVRAAGGREDFFIAAGEVQEAALELTPEERQKVEELRSKGRRADAAMWEAFYCEQKIKAAEADELERANAKRLEGLKRILVDEPSAAAWVMDECRFHDDGRKRGLLSVILGVLADWRKRGRPLWDTAPAMVAAWLDYDRIGHLLAQQYGPRNFFKLSIWERRNSWRIDERKRERLGARTGTA